jgi:four helix bundle protein
MAGVSNFTDLQFWQRARSWAKEIFSWTQKEAFCRERRLVEQINDSTDSVMANIAEGFGRGTQGEFVQFLGYSIGSLNETQSHLCTAYDRGYVSREAFGSLFQEGTEIRKMIVSFMRSMVLRGSGVKNIRRYKSWAEQVQEVVDRVNRKFHPEMSETKEEKA